MNNCHEHHSSNEENLDKFVDILGKVVPTRDGIHAETRCYEDLSLVYDEITKTTYISKKCVPCGIEITNEEFWQPFCIGNGIAPDEEDLTINKDSHLALKDRDASNGKGYVILRTDTSLEEQMTKSNTIYQIRYIFDLNGETLTIPENCILNFDGGSIINGKLISNNTIINGEHFNSDALYGVFYDDKNMPLCMGTLRFRGISSALEHAIVTTGSAREMPTAMVSQSLVVTSDNVYMIGTDGESPESGYVAAYDRKFNYIGQAQVPEFVHANGATLCGDRIYVAPNSDDYKIAYVSVADLIAACENNELLHANVNNNLPYIVRSFAIDYDEHNEEFVLLNRNSDGHCNMQVYDKNFNLLKNFETDLTAFVYNQYLNRINTDTLLPGTFGDIVAKDGVAYVAFWRKEGATSDASRQSSFYIEVDVTTGIPIRILGSLDSPRIDRIECEGFIKDPEKPNVFWVSFIHKKRGNKFGIVLANYFARVSFTEELVSVALMGSNMQNETLFSRQNESIVFVDNNYRGYSNGNWIAPYKSLVTAFLMTAGMTRSHIRIFESDKPYNVGNIELYDTEIFLEGVTRAVNIRGLFYFFNCQVFLNSLTYTLVSREGGITGFELSNSTIEVNACTLDTTEKDAQLLDKFFYINYNSTISIRQNVLFKDISIGVELGHYAKFKECISLSCQNVSRAFRINYTNCEVSGKVLTGITLDADSARKFTVPDSTTIPGIIKYYVPTTYQTISDLFEHLDNAVFNGVASPYNIELVLLPSDYLNSEIPQGNFYYADHVLIPVHNHSANVRPKSVNIGYQIYDRHLGKPLWASARSSDGTMTWVDANGDEIVDEPASENLGG